MVIGCKEAALRETVRAKPITITMENWKLERENLVKRRRLEMENWQSRTITQFCRTFTIFLLPFSILPG
jgi:hypothetical protein